MIFVIHLYTLSPGREFKGCGYQSSDNCQFLDSILHIVIAAKTYWQGNINRASVQKRTCLLSFLNIKDFNYITVEINRNVTFSTT